MSKSVRPPDKKSLQNKADSLAKELESLKHALSDVGNYQTSRGQGQDSRVGAEFPAQYFPDTTPDDDRVATKAKLLRAPDRPLGDAQLTDADIKWYQDKEAIKKRIKFDEWYSTLFDTDDINKRRLAQEIYPDYWKMREEEIDRQAAIQKKLAMLKLRGPMDLDDLKFVYALQSGEVDLRPVPLYDLDKPLSATDRESKFKKGLFNPSAPVNMGDVFRPGTLGRGMFGAGGSIPTVPGQVWNNPQAANINNLFPPGQNNPF
jgi:hypothetical protein